MDIVFRTRRLARIFNSREALVKQYGSRQAQKIMTRMAVLRAAAKLGDVPSDRPDRCHALTGDRAGQYAVDLVHPYRLVFRPYSQQMDAASATSAVNITSIEIMGVEDYH